MVIVVVFLPNEVVVHPTSVLSILYGPIGYRNQCLIYHALISSINMVLTPCYAQRATLGARISVLYKTESMP